MKNEGKFVITAILAILFLFEGPAFGQGTGFTYQGSLNTSGSPANGNYDFEFALFDLQAAGSQFGSTLSRPNIAVSNGVFSVSLDFGSQFPGANRFLEIRVRPSGGGVFTPLTPRQAVDSTPYSIKSLNAENASNATTATNATQLGGVAANQYVLTGDARLSDARQPTAGSASYIQNQNAAPQALSNFNISGVGSANKFNAAAQYDIGGLRVLKVTSDDDNTFVGEFTGFSNTTGHSNTFVGNSAGSRNTIGTSNAFFGSDAGGNVVSGNSNNFFGRHAGLHVVDGSANSFFGTSAGGNTTSSGNSFFGFSSGESNTTGTGNSFFGLSSGQSSTGSNNSFFGNESGKVTTGSSNAFFGGGSGFENVGGTDNSFFGVNTGRGNTTGNNNSYFGRLAGRNKTTGSNNTALGYFAGGGSNNGDSLTLIGAGADVSVAGLSFATAIGAGAVVGSSNTITLGRAADSVQVPGGLNVAGTLTATLPSGSSSYIQNQNAGPQASSNFNISGNGTAAGTLSGNIVNAETQYRIGGNRILSNPGIGNLFSGAFAGDSNSGGSNNSYFGANAGKSNSVTGDNSFFGRNAGQAHFNGGANSFFGALAGDSNTVSSRVSLFGNEADSAEALTNATAIGARAFVGQSDSLVLGSINGVNGATADTKVGIGTTIPTSKLTVADNSGFVLIGDAGCPAGQTAIGFHSPMSGCTNYALRGGVTDLFLNRPTGGAMLFRENNTSTQLSIAAGGNVGIGTVAPAAKLDVNGIIRVATLGAAGATHLCHNAADQISTCSSSARYKSNIAQFNGGLELLKRLRPVSFNWKDGGLLDLGLVAEDVAKVEPLLTTTNNKGEIEGVKYDRIGVVLINAVKEQQAQIEAQQKQIDAQKAMIQRLTSALCEMNSQLAVCKGDRK